MSSEQVTHHFCVESLRYAYHILGYETILKEIDFIHHLHSRKDIPMEEPSEDPVTVHDIAIPETKNVIIQNEDRKIYMRTPCPDELRCVTVVRGGERCSFQRDTTTTKNNTFCSRHTPKGSI